MRETSTDSTLILAVRLIASCDSTKSKSKDESKVVQQMNVSDLQNALLMPIPDRSSNSRDADPALILSYPASLSAISLWFGVPHPYLKPKYSTQSVSTTADLLRLCAGACRLYKSLSAFDAPSIGSSVFSILDIFGEPFMGMQISRAKKILRKEVRAPVRICF